MKDKFLTALAVGIVIFQYTKKDGSIRVAVGTTNKDLIPTIPEDRAVKLQEQGLQLTVAHKENNDEELIYGLEQLIKLYEPKKAKGQPHNENLVSYYDFTARGWRSFDYTNFSGATTPENISFHN